MTPSLNNTDLDNADESVDHADDDDESYGPVTRLAHRAAAQDEADRMLWRQQQLHEERAKLHATALAVGEAAWVIAKATTTTTTTTTTANSTQLLVSKSSSSSLNNSPSDFSPVKDGENEVRAASSSSFNDDVDGGLTTAREILSPMAAAPRRRQIQRQPPPPSQQQQQQQHDNEEEIASGNDDDDDDSSSCVNTYSFEDKKSSCHDDQCSRHESQYSQQHTWQERQQQHQRHISPPGKQFHSQHQHHLWATNSNDPSSSYSNGVVGDGDDNCGVGGGGGGGGGGLGLFASAKNWLQSQRERLHQLELERQVEDQRRKLVEEGRKQRAREAEERRRRTHRSGLQHHRSRQQQLQQVHTSASDGKNQFNDGKYSVDDDTIAFHPHNNNNNNNNNNNSDNDHGRREITTTTSTNITNGNDMTPRPTLFLPPILQDELCILPHLQGEMCILSRNRLPAPNTTASVSSLSPPSNNYSYSATSSSSTATTTITAKPSSSSSSFMCGFGTSAYYDYNPEMDDDLVAADYPGVARVDSYGNILEMIPSGSLDDENDDIIDHLHHHEEGGLGVVGKKKVYMSVSSPRWTCSGEGMSVKVDMDDFNDDSTCEGDDDKDNDIGNNIVRSSSVNIKTLESDDSATQQRRTGTKNIDGLSAVVEREDDPYFVSDIKIVPETPKDELSSSVISSSILRPSHMKSLIASGGLPPSLTFCKWKRLYSLLRDGDSFEQFLHRVEGHDRTILVVKTTLGGVFGGYADTRWEARHMNRHASEYFRSAQAFLFRFPNYGSGSKKSTDVEKVDEEEGSEENEENNENDVLIYRWSGVNRYIQLCDASRRTIAFGGGGQDGDFGLCIEDDFRRGTTGNCSTFANEALCDEGYFFVVDLEVWGFTLDF